MRGSLRSDERGYVSVYVALVASLVLVPLALLLIDFATLAYYRVKLKNAADAVAIAAVAESTSWHIPVPTEWAGWFPVNGWIVNGLNLTNLTNSGGLLGLGGKSKVNGKLQRLLEYNRDQFGQHAKVTIPQDAVSVQPLGNFFSPFVYVKVPVQAEVTLQTPYAARLFGKQNGRVTLESESCAAAWYRTDRWAHRWWNESPETLTDTIDEFINVSGEARKYYRLTNCLDGWTDWLSLAEQVSGTGLELSGEERSFLRDWARKDPRSRTVRDLRDAAERQDPKRGCQPGDPCVGEDRSAIDRWSREETARRRAEEEAEQARQQALEDAAHQDGTSR